MLATSPVFSQTLQLQEAEVFYRQGNFPAAILRLQEAAATFQQRGDARKEAIALTNLGNAQLALGQAELAAENLERAIDLYRQLGDEAGVKRGQIYLARSLQDLGLFLQACETLAQPLGLKDGVCGDAEFELPVPFHPQEIKGWHSFGEILRVLGKLQESQTVLEELAEILPSNSAILLSLGNTLRARGNLERDRVALPQYDYQPWRCGKSDPKTSGMNAAIYLYQDALEPYQEAANSTDARIRTQAQLNRLSLLLVMSEKEGERVEEARSLLSQIDLSPLPSSRHKIYAEINLAKSRACLMQLEQNEDDWTQVAIALNEATREAHELHDKRAESRGLGELGGFYEFFGTEQRSPASYKTARELTERALYLAQPQEAPDIAYQWQWQLGRLFAKQEDREAALRAYQGAVDTLKLAREDLLSLKTDVQYSFRDRVEPLYRQYLDLLLQPEASDKNLETAAKMVEELQLAELENFLRCRITNLKPIDEVENPPTAIIYPVLLKNRLEVIVKVPKLKLIRHYRQDISTQEMEDALFKLSGSLADRNTPLEEILEPAQELYSLLIRPIEKLPDDGTLMFVLESAFQQVPMTVLHDRDRYLVEKYSIATNLGSFLPDPKILELRQWEALIAGISKKADSFPDKFGQLSHVTKEIRNIAKIVSSRRLENEEFTRAVLQEEVRGKTYTVVHVSTHGTFDSNPKKTVIYTWDDKINVDELGLLLRNKIDPIELLVLSACETVKGDRRSPLGIAGVALRANAKSTVASLWKVLDGTTAELMKQFYQQLNQPNITKAEALRQAQLNFIQNKNYQHPYYWSAFILAGNWL